MKLVVGLGNPGKEYKNTRHNIGFMVLDSYLGKVEWKNKMEARIYTTEIDGEQVIFVKPMTYMNLSGLAVAKVVKYYKVDINDILVIQDDLDMALGTYKLKKNSSSGGHNGIKSIIAELNSEAFGRLKIGIGKNATIPVDKYVLSSFTKKEADIIAENMEEYKRIIALFIHEGMEFAIQEYNQN